MGRKRITAKESLLDTLGEFKSDLAIDPEEFDTVWEDVEDTPPLKLLFDSAGMDPKKVSHWQAILLACACSLFPEDEDFSPRGRDPSWTADVEDRLIEWWLPAKAADPNHGDRKLFAALIEKHGAFEIAPRHLMDDPESLRQRFLKIKMAAKQAVATGDARKQQQQLAEVLEKYRKR